MQTFAAIFWNRDERRPRAGWRLLIQFIAMMLLIAIWQVGVLGQNDSDALSSFGTLLLAILTVGGAYRLLDRRRVADLGLRFDRSWWLECLAGLLLSGALILAIFFCGWSLGWIAPKQPVGWPPGSKTALEVLALPVFYFIAVGFAEELYFRGYLLRNLAEGLRCKCLNEPRAILVAGGLAALLFAASHAHSLHSTLLSGLNTLLAGLLLASMTLIGRRLGGAIGFHVGWNYMQGGVFGFAVSGHSQNTPWIEIESSGPALWTGGAYGPEGGLFGTFAFVTGALLVWIYLLFRRRTAAESNVASINSPLLELSE